MRTLFLAIVMLGGCATDDTDTGGNRDPLSYSYSYNYDYTDPYGESDSGAALPDSGSTSADTGTADTGTTDSGTPPNSGNIGTCGPTTTITFFCPNAEPSHITVQVGGCDTNPVTAPDGCTHIENGGTSDGIPARWWNISCPEGVTPPEPSSGTCDGPIDGNGDCEIPLPPVGCTLQIGYV